MNAETAGEVVGRLEEALSASAGGVLAFDADGTIWSGDVGIDVFEALLRRRAVRPAALAALQAEATARGVAVADDPTAQAQLLYDAYVAERLPDGPAFAMMAWAFAGFSLAEADSFAASVIAEVGLADRIHGETVDILAWASRRGVPAYVVSASPRAMVCRSVEPLGISPERVLAMTPGVDDGVIAPRIVPPITYAHGKVLALEARVPGLALLGAFGDNVFDLELLAKARVPVAVRPKPALLARAGEVPGLVVLKPAR